MLNKMLNKLSRQWRTWLSETPLLVRRPRAMGRKWATTILRLEALEDRTVPTVLFLSPFGTEHTLTDNPANELNNATAQLVFWGDAWNTPTGRSEAASLQSATSSLFASPFYSGLQGYGSNGKISLVNTPVFLPGAFAGNTFTDPEFATVRAENEGGALPVTYSNGGLNNRFYIFITPPGVTDSSQPNAAGYHESDAVYNPTLRQTALVPYAFISVPALSTIPWAVAGGPLDMATRYLSHEAAETMTDPWGGDGGGEDVGVDVQPNAQFATAWVAAYPKLSEDVASPSEIDDTEPALGSYVAHVNGVDVQAYLQFDFGYSDAFIVPDGNAQVFYVEPQWSNGKVTGMQLVISGDQMSIANNQITVDTVPGASLLRLPSRSRSMVTLPHSTPAKSPRSSSTPGPATTPWTSAIRPCR